MGEFTRRRCPFVGFNAGGKLIWEIQNRRLFLLIEGATVARKAV